MERGVTHELAIGLGAGAEGLGEAVGDWLAERGVAFAESSMGAPELLVYDIDRGALDLLAVELGLAFPGAVALRHTALRDEAWQGVWDPAFERMTTRMFVVGQDEVHVESKRSLVLAPGSAFGQGDHATTEACLRAVESWADDVRARDRSGAGALGAMLDVGTGTGVLAMAAAHLGYAPVLGTDLDEAIIAEARHNAAHNDIAGTFVCTAEIPQGRYALVTANIPAPALHPLMPALAAAVAPGGALILAGFVEKEADALTQAARTHGLVEHARTDVRGWTGLTLSNPAR